MDLIFYFIFFFFEFSNYLIYFLSLLNGCRTSVFNETHLINWVYPAAAVTRFPVPTIIFTTYTRAKTIISYTYNNIMYNNYYQRGGH